jgi:hypothetical protein
VGVAGFALIPSLERRTRGCKRRSSRRPDAVFLRVLVSVDDVVGFEVIARQKIGELLAVIDASRCSPTSAQPQSQA